MLALTGKDDSALPIERRDTVGRAEWVLYGGVGGSLLDESADDYRWDVAEDVIARTVRFFSGVAAA